MFPAYKTLSVRPVDSTIVVVGFNRPEAANALNSAMAKEIKDFFRHIGTLKAIILTGEGKHFCAGADLKERKGMDEDAWHDQHLAFEGALYAIMHCDIPVIAAVNGTAFGGGLELALACDFIYASPTARFALTETTLGIIPGLGGTQHLPRAAGLSRAKECIFTGKPFSAEEALQWGVVNKLCPSEALIDAAVDCAKAIANNAPLAVKAAKKAMNQGIALPLDKALQAELTQYRSLLSTQDRHEGINAFNEKRKAAFNGN